MISHDSLPGFAGTIDAVVAVARHLEREWGPNRRLKVVGMSDGAVLAACSASDGSRWWIGADRWGNVVGDGDSFDEVRTMLDARNLTSNY